MGYDIILDSISYLRFAFVLFSVFCMCLFLSGFCGEARRLAFQISTVHCVQILLSIASEKESMLAQVVVTCFSSPKKSLISNVFWEITRVQKFVLSQSIFHMSSKWIDKFASWRQLIYTYSSNHNNWNFIRVFLRKPK